MGGLCSKISAVDQDGLRDREQMPAVQSDGKMEGDLSKMPYAEDVESVSDSAILSTGNGIASDADANESQLLKALSQRSRSTRSKLALSARSGATKVSEMSSILGKASSAGLGKAVEVLDSLGSSMTSLNLSSGFVSGGATKGNKISILAFEVANTIVKGANLMHSLSNESITHLKDVILLSEGVQFLISKDMDKLLRIAEADKREEFEVLCKEVVRFGNRCKDPQWHSLDRYFEKLASEFAPRNQLKEVAENAMEQLMSSVNFTSVLYHESHCLDRLDQEYKRKLQEEDSANVVQRVETLQTIRQELKNQRKLVKSLKKKSLWSKNLEEVLEKLVDIVHYLHLEIQNAFNGADPDQPVDASMDSQKRLGPAGLALHYANIISQIDTIVSRSNSLPPNTRDNLYQGLPPATKSSFRTRLQSFQVKEELTIPQIKAEMEKTLQWLVPMANNTTKAHHGFGWVGEWANNGTEKPSGKIELQRIETLYHADKGLTEDYILDLVVWLHYLVSHTRSGSGAIRSPIKSPVYSPTEKLFSSKPANQTSMLSPEDQEMLRVVNFRKLTPGISKSQEFSTANSRSNRNFRLSKSNSHSPSSSFKDIFPISRRPSMLPVIDFKLDKIKALDVIDRLDDIR